MQPHIAANETLFSYVTLINSTDYNIAHFNVCLSLPPHIISDGIWGGHGIESSPSKSSFPVFLQQFIVIYAIARALHFPVKKLGFPFFISQMIAGLILGPTWSGLEGTLRTLFPYGSQDTLATITAFGFVLFLFETGVKMDYSMIIRTGRKGWIIALLGSVTPLLVGFGSQNFFPSFFGSVSEKPAETNLIMIVHTTTSFAVIASVLNELQLLNSELGRLALSCALVGDILSNILITLASTFQYGSMFIIGIMRLGTLLFLVLFILFVYRLAMFWVIEHTPEGKEVQDIYISIIIGIVFSLCWFSIVLENGSMTLPFIFGLATPEGTPLGSTLIKRIHLLGGKLLLPIFLTTCAMKVQVQSLAFATPTLTTAAFIFLMGYLIKFATCLVSSFFFKIPLKDGLALALILSSKGIVEIIMCSTALDRQDLHPKNYSIIIVIIVIASIITHMLVKYLYDPSRKYAGYQKRNLFSLKPNSDLKILVCIHKQHHITPIIRVLDLCYPTTKDPIMVEALHLIELVGRTSPIFISHKKKKIDVSNLQNSYSENVILSFKLYEDDKQGAASINPYTALSPPNLMYEDVCDLALDRVASIIILPFHRKWSPCGRIEYEDKNMRALNCMVLERAPCSVGILVSRAIHQKGSTLRLALIFLGGNDDREALCLANRAARDPTIELVVYHIVNKNKHENEDLDTMLDITMLKDAGKSYSSLGNVSYRAIEVEDGVQTAGILRQMVEEHDFIIVGRRHGINSPQTDGLQEWSEFSELGLIGDYLASEDLGCKSSILVVQQQQLPQ